MIPPVISRGSPPRLAPGDASMRSGHADELRVAVATRLNKSPGPRKPRPGMIRSGFAGSGESLLAQRPGAKGRRRIGRFGQFPMLVQMGGDQSLSMPGFCAHPQGLAGRGAATLPASLSRRSCECQARERRRRTGIQNFRTTGRGSYPGGSADFGFNCGNRITSRMLSWPRSIMHRRSMPMPMPPAGGMPCSRATRKSSSSFCCSPPA